MPAFTERLAVRLHPDSMQLLRREADRRGISVSEAVRQAIDLWLEQDREERRWAAAALFQVDAPVADWEGMKEEITEPRCCTGSRGA
jgi:hypothetical protein